MTDALDVSVLAIDDAGRRLAALLTCGRMVTEEEFRDIERAAETHSVMPLLASRSDGERPRAVLREAAAVDAAATAGLRAALEVLHGAGLPAIVLKGAHLALTHYPAPHLRPRSDADLLIPAAAREPVRRALEAGGYALMPHVRGDLILAQMHLVREAIPFPQALDVHWQVLNPHAFHDLLPFEEAWARSRPIPALGASARGLCDADAMLQATTHPAAHHSGDVRLIWMVDIDRLAASMTSDSWTDFVGRARAACVARVALASLNTASRLLHTAVPDAVLEALAKDRADQRATAAYLLPATKAQRLWSELRVLNGWRTRVRYMRQHLFPDRDYMRAAYGGSPIMLPWRYFARIAFGAARWLRH